jgi:hypothetical protein
MLASLLAKADCSEYDGAAASTPALTAAFMPAPTSTALKPVEDPMFDPPKYVCRGGPDPIRDCLSPYRSPKR